MILELGRGWVCEIEHQVVGFAIVDMSCANIWALFVDPPFERRSVGRALHDTMLDWAYENGAEELWLSTASGTRAEHFYRSAAWRQTGWEPSGEIRFETTRDVWLFRQRLGRKP